MVIVGAGIAGSALAAALTGNGLAIALIEARPLRAPELPQGRELTDFDQRVSALTPRSQQQLEALGAWSAIADYRYCSYQHMTVWDADGTGLVEFDHSEVGAPALGHIVENRAIIAALLPLIEAAQDVTVLSPAAVEACEREEDDQLRITLAGGEAVKARLLVAADGAQSAVRELMGFRTREWDYGHRGLVATVELANSHEHTAWQRFISTGPLALLPLEGPPGRHFCSIVWSLDEDLVDDMLALDDAAFRAALAQASEGRLGAIRDCSARAAFPLRQRHAVDYVQPGVALVADAAHTIHPLAGQGINLGLQDVAALAEEILTGAAVGTSPGQLALLRRYQRRRKGENLLMMAAMDGFKRLFQQEALPVRWLRNVGMRGVNRVLPLKQQLMRHAMGLG